MGGSFNGGGGGNQTFCNYFATTEEGTTGNKEI